MALVMVSTLRTFMGLAKMAPPFSNMASNEARIAVAPMMRGPPGCTQTMSSSSAQQAISFSRSPCCRAW